MLKCPACHKRVLGNDLVTGVCSHCGQHLGGTGDSSLVISKQSGDPSSDTIDPFSISAVAGAASEVQHTDSAATFISDDIPEQTQAALRQEANSPASPPKTDPEMGPDRTYVSDVDFDIPVAKRDASESAQTFISDLFVNSDQDSSVTSAFTESAHDYQKHDTGYEDKSSDFDSNNIARTLISNDDNEPEVGASDRTVVSDDVPEAMMKTIESVWGEDIAKADARPDMTFKEKETQRPKPYNQTLVIKPKLLIDSKDLAKARKGDFDNDAEYELIKVLGEGGMGVVYDALQTSIGRSVALKMIKGEAAANEKQNGKFLAEAVVTGDLDHPNIVPIYDVGSNFKGQLFYSMKKVQGTPWMKVIAEKSLSENLDILMRTADAIGFAHARSIVHRDLKPENIMLGEFGEVLVMDWGLAHPLKGFRKSSSISQSHSMGGTPAYMAPEMATGPISKIGPASDIYLLGAILYEILTGKPPHVAKNAMKCLMAAARNEIAPTEKTGELIDIALKAMSTEAKDRYQDVKEFQSAIREYQSHLESIQLSSRAEDDLKDAKRTDDYQHYSRALFGFQESFELWSGNKRAFVGISDAKLAYAESAKRKGDFDLGLSLLDPANADHGSLHRELKAAQNERLARQRRLVLLRRAAIGLAAAVFVIVTGAAIWIRSEQQKAIAAAELAEKNEKIALDAKSNAEKAFIAEQKSKLLAEAAEKEAIAQRLKAEEAQKLEEKAKVAAIAAENIAVAERVKAEAAKQKEEYEAYISKIGLAASQIEKNAFDAARDVLATCKPELRNWEWGRLMHLCSQSTRSFDAMSPLEALTADQNGKRFATGGWDGMARLWDRESGKIIKSFKHGGEYVNAVALSPDGLFLATGSNDPAGYIQIWDITTGQRIKLIKGHDDEVLSLVYSKDGQRLLSSSYDKTARLWDASTGNEIKRFTGHTWWVWTASFSADERRVVTAGHDGAAIVWSIALDKRSSTFTGHHGPVFSAVFSPDGKQVVSAGYDRRILAWNPDEVKPFDFSKVAEGSVAPPANYRTFEGHTDAVRSIAFSPDGSLLLSASQDNTVRVWNFETAQSVTTFRGHGGRVKYAMFLSDGQRILSASQDNTVREWSISGYEEIRTLQGRILDGHADAILAAAYSRDQKQIITASRDRTARIWNASTGEPGLTLAEGHSYLASTAAFYPGGRRLLTAAVDNTTRVWDVATGGQLLRLDRSGRSAAAVISHNSQLIATGSDDKSAQLWDASTGQRLKKLEAHLAEVTAVAFSPDDRLVASGDFKGHVKLWNVEEGRVVAKLDGHSRRISAIAFSSDGKRVLTASGDNTVGQWDVQSGKELSNLILKHPDGILTMQAIPGGNMLVTSSADHQIRIWDCDQAKTIKTLGPFPGEIFSLSVSHDGRRLLTANSEERTVRLWELESGREIESPKADGKLGPFVDLRQHGGLLWATAFLPGTDDVLTVGGTDARLWDAKSGKEKMSFSPHGAVASANFSPNGELIVTGSWDNSAKLWNAKTGKVIRKLEGGHSGFVNMVTFSPDNRFVLTASDDGTAKLWNVESGEVVKTLEGHRDRVRSAVFSLQGDLILTTSSDKTARLWKAETGAFVREFKGHDWAVVCGEFSKDGTRIVTGSEDKFVRTWNVETGESMVTLSGHTAFITSVGFSPDASRIITGSQDQVAKLWDARTGKEILTLSRHKEEVTSVAFSPDGKQVLTGSRDGTAIIWLSQDWADRPGIAGRSDLLPTRRPLVK